MNKKERSKISHTSSKRVLKAQSIEEYAKEMWASIDPKWLKDFAEELKGLPELSDEELSLKIKELEGKA